jgi:hypothetical protein
MTSPLLRMFQKLLENSLLNIFGLKLDPLFECQWDHWPGPLQFSGMNAAKGDNWFSVTWWSKMYFIGSSCSGSHHWLVKGCKIRPMLSALGLWAGRDLYCATLAVTQDLGFSGLVQRTAPISCLLRHTRGCGGSILTRILRAQHRRKTKTCLADSTKVCMIRQE